MDHRPCRGGAFLLEVAICRKERPLANLQVKVIDDGFYEELQQPAAAESRSVSQQVVVIPAGVPSQGALDQSRVSRHHPGSGVRGKLRLDDFDLALAATSLAQDLVLVTSNVRHFGRIEGLRPENRAAPG